jgi:hypothetical protein
MLLLLHNLVRQKPPQRLLEEVPKPQARTFAPRAGVARNRPTRLEQQEPDTDAASAAVIETFGRSLSVSVNRQS